MADRQSTYSVSLFGGQMSEGAQDSTAPSRVQQALIDFIMEFTLDNIFVYRDQIRENVLLKQYYCDIDMAHLINYNDGELAHMLKQNPAEVVPLVRIPCPFRVQTLTDTVRSRTQNLFTTHCISFTKAHY